MTFLCTDWTTKKPGSPTLWCCSGAKPKSTAWIFTAPPPLLKSLGIGKPTFMCTDYTMLIPNPSLHGVAVANKHGSLAWIPINLPRFFTGMFKSLEYERLHLWAQPGPLKYWIQHMEPQWCKYRDLWHGPSKILLFFHKPCLYHLE